MWFRWGMMEGEYGTNSFKDDSNLTALRDCWWGNYDQCIFLLFLSPPCLLSFLPLSLDAFCFLTFFFLVHYKAAIRLDQCPLRHLVVALYLIYIMSPPMLDKGFPGYNQFCSEVTCVAKNRHYIQINTIKATGFTRKMGQGHHTRNFSQWHVRQMLGDKWKSCTLLHIWNR